MNKKISTGEVSTEISPDGTVVITQGTKGGLGKPTVSAIDKDIIWQQDGTEIFLPRKVAGIGGIILGRDLDGEIKNAVKPSSFS